MASILGCLPIKRVKFSTMLEHEYIQNCKLLQASFKKVGVDKVSVYSKMFKLRKKSLNFTGGSH